VNEKCHVSRTPVIRLAGLSQFPWVTCFSGDVGGQTLRESKPAFKPSKRDFEYGVARGSSMATG
jgi:hypothetical protein